jgi:ATP-binding cassette subfamily F protein 3
LQVYARLDAIDAHSANARASEILIGLGFTQDGLKTQTSRLSGGWRMRCVVVLLWLLLR